MIEPVAEATMTQESDRRALIAVGVGRHTQIMVATDSESLRDAADYCGSCCLVDVMGELTEEEAPVPGLYLWEGSVNWTVSTTQDGAEPDYDCDGTVRPVKPEELAGLLAMAPDGL